MIRPLLCRLGIHRHYTCECLPMVGIAIHHCTGCTTIWRDSRSQPHHVGHTRYTVYSPSRQMRRAARRSLERLGRRAERILRG